jgi:hypothetical protein
MNNVCVYISSPWKDFSKFMGVELVETHTRAHAKTERCCLHTNMRGYTGRFIMFSVITNINNKKTKGPILMELFTATENLKKFL